MVSATLEADVVQRPADAGLTFVQLNLLKLLLLPPPHGEAWSVKSIAASLEVSLAAASKLVSRLERGGWVQVSPSEEDRRRLLVKVSRKGRNAKTRHEARELRSVESLRKQAGDASLRRWNQVLEEIVGLLVRESGPEAVPCLRCGTYTPEACVVETQGVLCPVRHPSRS
jgi:DNA-binding MarR family transcriptional regulator